MLSHHFGITRNSENFLTTCLTTVGAEANHLVASASVRSAQKTKFKRFPEIFPPRTFFFVSCVSVFQLLHITIFLPISSHFSLILFSSKIISTKSSFSLSSMRRAFSTSGSIAGALFSQSNIALPSALLITATAMIIFFVVRVALIRAVVPVCLICAVVWIVLICVMVQLFFAVGVTRYSVFFVHYLHPPWSLNFGS